MPKSVRDRTLALLLDGSSFALIVAGPSGVGKTSICQGILGTDSRVRACVTTTTRPKRSGEMDGVDYDFVSVEAFQERIEKSEFVEWAKVHGFFYGATFDAVSRALSGGEVMLLDVDVQGMKRWKSVLEDRCVTVFVVPPSIEALEKRLEERKTEDASSFKMRMEDAKREVSLADGFDYLIVNGDLDRAVSDLEAIISAERCRPHRMGSALSRLRDQEGWI